MNGLVEILPSVARRSRVREVLIASGPVAARVATAVLTRCYVPDVFPGESRPVAGVVSYEGSIAKEVVTEDAVLLTFVADYLAGGECRFAIFENELARAGDAVLERIRSQLLFHDERVMHWLASRSDPQTIQATIAESRTTPDWAAVLGEMDAGMIARMSASTILTAGDVESIARAARLVIVGASDGESFLVCEVEFPHPAVAGKQ